MQWRVIRRIPASPRHLLPESVAALVLGLLTPHTPSWVHVAFAAQHGVDDVWKPRAKRLREASVRQPMEGKSDETTLVVAASVC
jgi:hypothetical protein